MIDEVAAKLLFLPKNLLENYNLREILRDYLDPVFSILNYRIFTLGDAPPIAENGNDSSDAENDSKNDEAEVMKWLPNFYFYQKIY